MATRRSILLMTGMLTAAIQPACAEAQPQTTDIACTQIGCVDGLNIAVGPAHHWAAGAYDFTFVMPGRTVNCTGTLPLKPCGTSSIACDGPGVMIGESGCALPANTHGFADIRIDGAPKTVSVTLKHNGTTIARQDIAPTYVTSRPNGPQCEPVCHAARDTLNLR